MRPWNKRSTEVAQLLNPPFCCILLSASIMEYKKVNSDGMDFPLIFIILPVIFSETIRNSLPKSKSTPLTEWIQKNSDIVITFYNRAISMKEFTQEALLFGLSNKWLILEENGKLQSNISKYKLDKSMNTFGVETKEIIKKSAFLGRWFASAGTSKTVMNLWRIKP